MKSARRPGLTVPPLIGLTAALSLVASLRRRSASWRKSCPIRIASSTAGPSCRMGGRWAPSARWRSTRTAGTSGPSSGARRWPIRRDSATNAATRRPIRSTSSAPTARSSRASAAACSSGRTGWRSIRTATSGSPTRSPPTGSPKGDKRGHQVVKFSPDGKVLMTLGTPGIAGSGPDHFNSPSDVVVAPNGDVFVADGHNENGNNRVVKFSKDGKFIKEWGKTGYAPERVPRDPRHRDGFPRPHLRRRPRRTTGFSSSIRKGSS